jgi:ferredoxin
VGRWLKPIRVAVALAVATAAALAFLDFGRILPVRWAGALARAQLVPAVLRLPSTGALVTLAVLTLVTLLFGRVYCSTLCPLGTLQDVVIRLRRPPDRRRRLRSTFQRPRVAVHLAVSGAAIAIAAAGHLAALELLEPWSSFGRTLGTVGRPIVALTLNAASRLFALAHVYALPPVKSPPLVWPALLVAVAWVVGIGALSLARGRLYCNLLCPAGALLHLLSRRTAFALTIDAAKCTGCGLCARECKARCIDVSRRRIEYAACVACFDCVAVCPKGAFGFTRTRPAKTPCAADRGRRELLRSAGVVATGLLVPGVVRGSAPDPRDRRRPVVPPGAGDERHFTSRCTACQLCVAACPTQVLRPSLTEYGLGGLLQPRLVFDAGACVYDCHRCGEVCPTGAIMNLPLDAKRRVQVGRARFVKEECVVKQKHKACGACAEHCPTKAVQMVPFEGALRIPELKEELCIGCGACEHPCPTSPRKAIWVEARSPHGTAKKPKQPALTSPLENGADFPF